MAVERQSAAFWSDPPWQNGNGGYQMQLKPLTDSKWCNVRIDQQHQKTKLRVLEQHPSIALQSDGDSAHAQKLLADAIGAKHKLATSSMLEHLPLSTANQNLLYSALTVPEDLCLMQRYGNAYRLIAACVCAPSYWYLPEKVGQSLNEIHAPVPGLNSKLGARMQDFFERLPDDRVFTRRNWLIHSSDHHFQPQVERRERLHTREQAEALIVRSETQTLRRLSKSIIAFTIKVSCYPLLQIYHHKAAANSLSAALHSRTQEEKEAAGQPSYEAAVSELLTAAAAGTPPIMS